MKKPNKTRQAKDLKRGQKKRKKQLEKNKVNKIKSLKRKAQNTEKKKAERETFQLEDEVRRIRNKGLTYRKPKNVEETT